MFLPITKMRIPKTKSLLINLEGIAHTDIHIHIYYTPHTPTYTQAHTHMHKEMQTMLVIVCQLGRDGSYKVYSPGKRDLS